MYSVPSLFVQDSALGVVGESAISMNRGSNYVI